MNRVATTKQLERYAGFLARLVLEVERDLRPPDQLLQFIPMATWRQWQRGRQAGRFRGGPVQDADIGPPHLQRVSATHALASVTTRTDPHRWAALTMQLDARRGRWAAVSLQRLYAARHYRTGPPTPVVAVPLTQQIDAARELRHHAAAALAAVQHHRRELPARSSGRHHLDELSTTWNKLVADLDRQLATLNRQVQTGQQAQRQLRRLR